LKKNLLAREGFFSLGNFSFFSFFGASFSPNPGFGASDLVQVQCIMYFMHIQASNNMPEPNTGDDERKPLIREIELTIPIMPDMEITATHTATSVAEYMKFDADRIDELKMALIEAIINAFEHSKSRDGKVRIKFLIGDDNLTVIIQDHGQGFDIQEIEKPEIASKLRASYKRGWGLMLIEKLMDTVYVESNEHGTTLVMSKNRN
jgi:anti-sigma regulatory factor (Ser/Thr protein kinase)